VKIRHLTRTGPVTALALAAMVTFPPMANAAPDPHLWVRIINSNSGMCLGVSASSKKNGAKVIQWPCLDDEHDQQWEFLVKTNANPPRYWVKNRNSGKCLAIPNNSIQPGKRAIQWTCIDKGDQGWVVPNPSSWTTLINDNSSMCLGINAGSKAKGARAIQWWCEYDLGGAIPDQTWKRQLP
jgi:pectate lyase